jgi:hypothetical protein
MCFCYFDPFGSHRAPMQNPSVFDVFDTSGDQKMTILDAFLGFSSGVPFLDAFGGHFGVLLGVIWEPYWGPWGPCGQPWGPLGPSWGSPGSPLAPLGFPCGIFGSSLAILWDPWRALGGSMGIHKRPFEMQIRFALGPGVADRRMYGREMLECEVGGG